MNFNFIIEAQNLKKIYGQGEAKTFALNGVSFKVKQGEFLSIMGPSGCGKSTLMHIIGFLDYPTSGTYKFEGKSPNELTDSEISEIRNKKIGFIFQFFNLLPRTTVLENVKLPLVYTKLSNKEKQKRALQALEAVGMSHRLKFYPNQLSGGEQQRVAIARAIVNQPKVILADEPTGNLDSKSGQKVMEILQKLNEQGQTIILVTHEKYTSEMAERIIYLKDGEIIGEERVHQRKFAKDGLVK